ncbi:hypothetical protein [Opitutus sp. GAS368]|jgi:hypothetical protein|uniref:hypothetical protein n=1 Tax=Opitutus sp. GAS368 TaxID=1882749 RepID=UPI00087B761E|nr:hypothetical protein [Opitutus sp. GAS368]SDR69299.1 hypothetical protein SAMN05444173_0442 [Opitutus sp. GAS368]
MKTLVCTLALAAGFVLAGCSTPATRISQNPAAFDRATPEQQSLIKQGKVGIGFDESLVQLALGVPDRITDRTSVHGKTVTWHYVDYETDEGMLLYRGWYHRGFWGGPYAYYADFPNRRARDHFKVMFSEGKVVLIEEER